MKRLIDILINNKSRLISLSDQGLMSMMNFAIGIMGIRLLGLADFGIYAELLIYLFLVLSFQQALIIQPMLTLVAQEKNAKAYLDKCGIVAFGLSLLSGLILSGISVFVLGLNNVGWVALYGVGFVLHDFVRKRFYAKDKAVLALVMDFLIFAGVVGVMGLALVNQTPLVLSQLIALLAVSYGTSVVFFLISGVAVKGLSSLLKQHWAFGRWLLATSGVQWFAGNWLILLAASVTGPAAAGIVRVGQTVIGLLHVFFLALENHVPTRASRVYVADGKLALQRYLNLITVWGGTATILFCLAIGFFAPTLLSLLFDQNGAGEVAVLRWYALMYPLVFWSYPLRFALRTVHQNREIFVAYFLSAAISAAVGYPLVQTYGVIGTMIGLLVAQLVNVLWYQWSWSKFLKGSAKLNVKPL